MSAPEPSSPLPARGRSLAVVLGVLFLTFLDTTIVSVTLGDLETDISVGVIPLQWIINAYALTFASLMLLGGSLADRFGRQRVMLSGLGVFGLGSLMCAMADTSTVLIAGRAVMGLGAAACEPGTLAVIRQMYPDRGPRARALGAWSATSGLGLAVGPVLGGLLVAAGDWRWVFWFNLIATVLLLAAVFRLVPDGRDPHPGRPDLAGTVLVTAGLGLVIFAAIQGEYQGYTTSWVVALFVLGAASLVGFVVVETRTADPLLDLGFICRPIVAVGLFAAFAIYFAAFAIFFFTALYLDVGLGYSGTRLATMFAPMAVAIVAGGALAGRWVVRAGSRLPLVTGCALAAAGVVLARLELDQGADMTAALLSLALGVAGLGFGVTVVPLTSSVLGHAPVRRAGMAASATNTARQLGAVVAVAALGAIVNDHLVQGVRDLAGPFAGSIIPILETGGSTSGFSFSPIPAPLVRAFLDGLQTSLLVALALIVIAGLLAALVREPALDSDDG